jgi:ribonuclease E
VADDIEGPEVAAPVEEPAAEESPEAAAEPAAKPSRRRGARGGAGRTQAAAPEAAAAAEPEDEVADEAAPVEAGEADAAPLDDEPSRSPRKRGRRRGRGRGGSRGLEARLLTGSVLLLDPSVASDPTFQEHWGDAGALRVEVSTDAIVLRRIAADPEPERSDR